jgi:hypothetical protein
MGLSAWACLRPLHRRGPSPGFQDGLLFAAAALSALNALLPESYLHSGALHGIGEALPLRAAGCFVWGFVMAALGVALAFGVLRGPRGLGSVPGSVWALGVLLAQIALALHCPLMSRLHLALGHASLSVAIVLVVFVARGWWRRGHSAGYARGG